MIGTRNVLLLFWILNFYRDSVNSPFPISNSFTMAERIRFDERFEIWAVLFAIPANPVNEFSSVMTLISNNCESECALVCVDLMQPMAHNRLWIVHPTEKCFNFMHFNAICPGYFPLSRNYSLLESKRFLSDSGMRNSVCWRLKTAVFLQKLIALATTIRSSFDGPNVCAR